ADFKAGMPPFLRQADSFVSLTCGSQQRLPNGNYLVTESNGGTIYEVTPDKEVVWKYVNTMFDGESIGGVYGAMRFTSDELPFLNEAASDCDANQSRKGRSSSD
ncbi:MAG: arylsulfotransferase family protein, partial [Desulfosudaceae bacterium]